MVIHNIPCTPSTYSSYVKSRDIGWPLIVVLHVKKKRFEYWLTDIFFFEADKLQLSAPLFTITCHCHGSIIFITSVGKAVLVRFARSSASQITLSSLPLSTFRMQYFLQLVTIISAGKSSYAFLTLISCHTASLQCHGGIILHQPLFLELCDTVLKDLQQLHLVAAAGSSYCQV